MKIHTTLFALVFAAGLTTVAQADTYVMIRNAKAPKAPVSKVEVRAFFTGKTKMFGNDVAVVVVPTDDTPAFGGFVDQVFSTNTKTLLAKIKQEVFKGDMAKPLKAATDDDVIRLVSGTAGAIGVVAPAAVKTLPSSVVVLVVGG